MTSTTYRTGFERVYDCPAGRQILDRIRARTLRCSETRAHRDEQRHEGGEFEPESEQS